MKKNKTVWVRLPRPAKLHKNTVIVEFNNCAPIVYTVTSERPLDINRIAAYFEKTEGFNEDRDSLTIVSVNGEIAELSIDKKPKA